MSEIEAHRGTLAVCCRPTFIKWSVIAVLVFVVALVFASCALAMIRNSWHLHQMERALATIAPPPQSERLAIRSGLGVLTGNGNHCDFFAGAIFVSKSAPGAIRQHYAGRTFLNPLTS